jgi:hypothetical protein
MVKREEPLSIRCQCNLVSVSRGSFYYKPLGESEANLKLMRLMDEHYLEHPSEGVKRMRDFLLTLGILANHKRIRRLLRLMGLMAIYPKKNLSRLGQAKYIRPYLLRDLKIIRPNQVWAIDISVPQLSSMRDEGRPLATGLQELVANHRKRRKSKSYVVSVTEKVPLGIRYESERRTTVNCRSSVESAQMTSKPKSDVAPGLVWRLPAYCSSGVRRRGSVSLIQALSLNCGNLRRRCKAKGTSSQGEANSSDASSRGGAARSSVETVVMTVERRGCVIQSLNIVNRDSGRSID